MVYYLVGLLFRTVFKKKSKIIIILLCVAVSGFLAYGVFGWGIPLWVSWGIGTILLYRGISFLERRWQDIFPQAVLWLGMLEYFISYFLFKNIEVLKPYLSIISWAGFVYVAVILIIFNSQRLKTAALTKGEEPIFSTGFMRHNRLLVGIVFFIIGIIACFKQLKEGVGWLVNKIIGLIALIISFLMSLLPMSTQDGGQPQNGMLDMLPEAESKAPTIFDYLLEILAYILTIAVAVILALLLIRVIYKGIKKLLAALAKALGNRELLAQDGGYVDMKERLVDLKGLGRNYTNRLRDWLTAFFEREPKWEELTDNRDRIRYLYRHLIVRYMALGYQPKKHMTPNEIKKDIEMWNREKGKVAEPLIPIYNQVRYSHDVDEAVQSEEIEHLARVIRSQ
jgi:hypothetical protein